MNRDLGCDVFWDYWRKQKLKIIGYSEGWYAVAVYAQAIPSALEIFFTHHLGGSRFRTTSVNNPRQQYVVQIFHVPQSKEIERIKHPFASRDDAF